MGLPQLTTEKLRSGEVGASDPVGVTDAAARWHLTRSYPLPFWARRVSLLSPISPYGPLMALHSRSTFPSSPSPRLPFRLADRGTLSPGLRTSGYPFARLGRGTWASQGLRALVSVHLRGSTSSAALMTV